MQDLVISLVTVCFNAEATIERCISSAINQSFKNLEYIIIDGGSTDNTLNIVKKFQDRISIIISEPDGGIYDAMNKGIKNANGQIVGMLNADDYFANSDILREVASAFDSQNTDIVYGDLDFVTSEGKIVRKWRSGKYFSGIFNWGWMPPHPTFYCKKDLFNKLGVYSLDFGTAADYELMARFMHLNKPKVSYIKMVLVKMQVGGVSNKSLRGYVKTIAFNYKAMIKNEIFVPFLTITLKAAAKSAETGRFKCTSS